jgi:hypothetical protein
MELLSRPSRNDALLSAALVLSSIGGLFAARWLKWMPISNQIRFVLGMASLICFLALLCAGCGALWKRKFAGAVVGIVVGILTILLIELP